MAIRGAIHINELEKFEKHLLSKGWSIIAPIGIFEVVRAVRVDGSYSEILIGYKRFKSDHLSFRDQDNDTVESYLMSKPKKL